MSEQNIFPMVKISLQQQTWSQLDRLLAPEELVATRPSPLEITRSEAWTSPKTPWNRSSRRQGTLHPNLNLLWGIAARQS